MLVIPIALALARRFVRLTEATGVFKVGGQRLDEDIDLQGFTHTITDLAKHFRQWLVQGTPDALSLPDDLDQVASHLTEVHGFGSNPGALRMFKYVPPQPDQTLVVVLHGGTQTATSYDLGAGWSTLADRYGFVLLLPQQQPANNPHRCFNWFLVDDIERDKGEALSIRQMVEAMICDYHIDRGRVFVTGLSAGGAMTSVMLATYPETFAAGGVVAGLPYRTATNMKEALGCMSKAWDRSPREWGDLVRAASSHRGAWPRVSVWHGSDDPLVRWENAREIVDQWTDVLGLNGGPSQTQTTERYAREVWRNSSGTELVECYMIPKMAHGTPLASGNDDDECGIPDTFSLEVGISSSYHIAKFWGLTGLAKKLLRQSLAAPCPRLINSDIRATRPLHLR
jgi:poly(hydroxyalkanoate) depolymerase family esterase